MSELEDLRQRVATLEAKLAAPLSAEVMWALMTALYDIHHQLIQVDAQTKAEAIQRLEHHIVDLKQCGAGTTTLTVLRHLQLAIVRDELSLAALSEAMPQGQA